MALSKPFLRRVFSIAVQTRAYSAPAERTVPAAKKKYVPTSGTYPKGFLAGSSHAGVKASNTQYDDIAMVVSEKPCPATGVFTRNLFKAAPVRASRQALHDRSHYGSDFRGVVVNSGCANAVTGAAGLEDANAMMRAADACFGDTELSEPPKTFPMSTGVIGQRLPMDKIKEAIPKAHAALGSEHENWMSAARAICTTDTFPKLLSRTFTLPSHPDVQYRMAGMTKGAGMIHPNMGTLLGIICTDAKIAPGTLFRLLRAANSTSFNSITIDGDTSTNDTVLLFANGAAAPADSEPLDHGPKGVGDKPHQKQPTGDVRAFLEVLKEFMADLAKLVVRDGEGATKFVTVRVRSEIGYTEAKSAATSIATSSLVKTALYGKDANWGRILCAIGYANDIMPGTTRLPRDPQEREKTNAQLKAIPSQTSVSFVPADGSPELKLLVRGEPETVDEERAKQILEMEDLEILVDMCDRDLEPGIPPPVVREATVWTCDFSHEYVTINGDYRT